MAGGTDVRVWGVGGVPVVKLKGPIEEKTGRELADRIMLMVALSTADKSQFTHPLSVKPGDPEYSL